MYYDDADKFIVDGSVTFPSAQLAGLWFFFVLRHRAATQFQDKWFRRNIDLLLVFIDGRNVSLISLIDKLGFVQGQL